MPLTIRSMGSAEQDREVDELARQIKLLKNQIAALTTSAFGQPTPIPSISGGDSGNNITVQQVDATIITNVAGLSFDQSNGFAITEVNGLAQVNLAGGAGVLSLCQSGSTLLGGNITLTGSGGVMLTQAAQNIDINMPMGVSSVAKSGSTAITGAATFTGAGTVTLTQAGNNITISATGSSGITSAAKSGSTAITGALTFTGSGTTTLTQAGNNIDISSAGGGGSTISVNALTNTPSLIDTVTGGELVLMPQAPVTTVNLSTYNTYAAVTIHNSNATQIDVSLGTDLGGDSGFLNTFATFPIHQGATIRFVRTQHLSVNYWYLAGSNMLQPSWVKVGIAYTLWGAGAVTTANATIYTLPASAVIHACKIKHYTAFLGGTITGVTVSVGKSGSNAKYMPSTGVFSTPTSLLFGISSSTGMENDTVAATITATITVSGTGATLASLTQGNAYVWLLISYPY